MTNELVDQLGLTQISENNKRDFDIVFVHGLGGGSHTSWAFEQKKENFWPSWLAETYPQSQVWTLGYNTKISDWQKNSVPISDVGNQVLELLSVRGIGEKPIIFITHSMGGLLFKQIILSAKTLGVARWENVVARTKGIAFLSTPHRGSGLANFAKFASLVLKTSEQVEELAEHENRLRHLHGAFLAHVQNHSIVCRSYAEELEVRAGFKIPWTNVEITIPRGILVVGPDSAEPDIPGERAIHITADHLSICKPENQSAPIHLFVQGFIRDCIQKITEENERLK